MTIRDMRIRMGSTQTEFARRYHIPFRTLQNWETGVRTPPDYVLQLLEERVKRDLTNQMTITLPKHDQKKSDLPERGHFNGILSWLRAVRDAMNEPVVFALDEALMCHQYFLGRNEEFLVWVYGNDSLTRFNGVVVLGNEINPYDVIEKNGLCYTSFNRTITDALANASILDMQGITEALSAYYFLNEYSFEGIYIPPEYGESFNRLALEAIEYYNS